jgi:hypothetical protein
MHAEARAENRRLYMRRLTAVAPIALTVAVVGASATIGARHQFVSPIQRCNLASLSGAYGLQWVGTRQVPSNPAVFETFTGVAIRGTFTQASHVKGSVSGLEPENIDSAGTYEVHEDCRGTAIAQFVPGAPVVTARFVIVDDGDEVLQSVMTPVPIFNAGVLKKVHQQ